jgi:DHA1 family inner membrane transport protein
VAAAEAADTPAPTAPTASPASATTPTPRSAPPTPTGQTTPPALYALALAAFAIGTTEFVVVGLLPKLSAAFGVSSPTAGLLVTGYAAGVALGGPLLALAVRRLPLRRALVGLMVLFAVGHVVMALAPSFPVLLIARLSTASAHGAFFGLGAVAAGAVVEPARRGRAVALMFTGLSVATVAGVPGGTLLGERLGWPAPFAAVAVLSALAAVVLHRTVPERLDRPEHGDEQSPETQNTASTPRRAALVAALLTTVVGWGSMFVAYTFLTPYLEKVTGFASGTVTALLLVFGGAAVAGGLLGGRAGDRYPKVALPVTLVALSLVLAGMWAAGGNKVLVTLLLAAWGVTGFALIPGLQTAVLRTAGPDGTLASTLNIAAFNVGIAAGSVGGELLVGAGLLRLTPFVGAMETLTALIPLAQRRRSASRSQIG